MKGIGRVLSIGATLVLLLSLATAVYAHKATSTGNAALTSSSGTTYALVVGISDYYPCGTGGPDLSYADDDADAFEGALNTVYGILLTKITKLKDCLAIKTDIQDWFTEATPSGNLGVTSNDDIVFFASGHGTRTFCPNGRVGNAILVNTATGVGTICEDELRGWFDAITAARKVVILDISFPSQFRNSSFRDATNTLLITAARGEAREAEFTDPTHTCYPGRGIFTCWFVERGILDGEANSSLNPHTYNDSDFPGSGDPFNEIPFEEAYDYVFHNVPPIQKPGIQDNASDDFLPTD